jgi:hypothetical protein
MYAERKIRHHFLLNKVSLRLELILIPLSFRNSKKEKRFQLCASFSEYMHV